MPSNNPENKRLSMKVENKLVFMLQMNIESSFVQMTYLQYVGFRHEKYLNILYSLD